MSESPFQPAGPGPSGPSIELAPRVVIARDLLRIQASRGGGPGGQNVNKVNTRIEVWLPLAALASLGQFALQRLRTLAGSRLTLADEIHIVAGEHRSQEANRQAAFDRIRELLVAAMHRPKPRRPTKPTRSSRRRRLDSKRHRGEVKSQRRHPGDE